MEEQRSGIFQSIRFWQGWSVAATAAALFAFIAHVEYPVDGNVPDYVAIVGEAGSEPLWVVNANLADGVIQVRAGTATAPGDDEVYRLWVVRQDDPQEIGVLPVDRGRETFALDKAVRAVLAHGQTLGVSRDAASDAEDDAKPTTFEYRATVTRL